MKFNIIAGVVAMATGFSFAFSANVFAQGTPNDEGITPFSKFDGGGAVGGPGAKGPGSGPSMGGTNEGFGRKGGGLKGRRGGGRHMGGGGAFKQIRRLLNQEQQQSFQSVVKEHRQRMQPLSQELKALRQEAQANPQGFDATKKQRMKQLRQQLMADRQGVQSQLMNLLTPDQKAQLDSLKNGPAL